MKKIYATYAEQRAARNARQNAKRAQLVATGLTTKGVPRRRYVRGAGIHSIGSRHLIQAPAVPTQTVKDFIAHGGRVEVLPGASLQPASAASARPCSLVPHPGHER